MEALNNLHELDNEKFVLTERKFFGKDVEKLTSETRSNGVLNAGHMYETRSNDGLNVGHMYERQTRTLHNISS
jgi:hypothetical protein